MEYILLVTWLYPTQASSYQVEFATVELCVSAMEGLAHQKHGADAAAAKPVEVSKTMTLTYGLPPILTMSCAKRK